MKAINYKIKKLNRFVHSSQKKLLGPAIIQNMSYVNKKNVKYDKNQKLFYFFLWKTVVEASKVITNSKKTLDFVTPKTLPLLDLSLEKYYEAYH